METEEESSLFGLNIDPENTAALRTAAQWGKLLSVLGFILGALMIIYGIILYGRITETIRGSYYSRSVQSLAIRYLLICVVFGGIFITGAVFTLNFSSKTIAGLNANDQSMLNSGLSSIKNGIIFWSISFIGFIFLMLFLFFDLATR